MTNNKSPDLKRLEELIRTSKLCYLDVRRRGDFIFTYGRILTANRRGGITITWHHIDHYDDYPNESSPEDLVKIFKGTHFLPLDRRLQPFYVFNTFSYQYGDVNHYSPIDDVFKYLNEKT